MKKYLIVSVLLFARNEVLSLIVLCIFSIMFIWDMFGWMQEGKW